MPVLVIMLWVIYERHEVVFICIKIAIFAQNIHHDLRISPFLHRSHQRHRHRCPGQRPADSIPIHRPHRLGTNERLPEPSHQGRGGSCTSRILFSG